ncbi:hypothetical protein [Phocaeicola barnesiae]|uniref:hypothetical protein n=1 Tax=Phocaeicola barnesiae TaxID=376804 RepID=UPI0025A3391A|nr:hypothetical protein [Phocaeicola barnesiae]MDM8309706.1 hypothetical protein [Phocaeicola barnesiae]
MAKKNTNRPAATDEDRKKYQEAWAEMMVTIWREKIERLHVIDTYSLHQQIKDNVVTSSDSISTIQHKFLEYGIYQDLGVGNGYSKDNGGNLEILDPVYRAEHNMGEPRKPRVWFSRSYFASVMVLKEQMAYMYGEEFCGLLVDKIEEANHKRSTTLRSRLYGTRKRK